MSTTITTSETASTFFFIPYATRVLPANMSQVTATHAISEVLLMLCDQHQPTQPNYNQSEPHIPSSTRFSLYSVTYQSSIK